MNRLLIATHNPGKLQEIKEYLSGISADIFSLSDLGVLDDVVENGKTYEENSQKKALFYAKLTNLPAISDDGGLEIDALGGEPGIRSRRWLGHHGSDQELLEHLAKIAKNLPEDNRRAKFVTVVSYATPDGFVISKRGEVSGIIAREPLNEKIAGLPYRSYFFLPEINKYYSDSELTESEKIEYNHRLKAIQLLIPYLQKSYI